MFLRVHLLFMNTDSRVKVSFKDLDGACEELIEYEARLA